MKIIRRIAKRKRLINAHFEMAKNDVVAFAQGKASPSPFISPPSLLIDFLARPKSVDPKLFRRIAEDTKAHIEEIRDRHGEYFSGDRPPADELKADNKQPSFEEYWNRLSLPGLEIIAEDCAVLDQCRNRGIADLLQLRSVRIGLFANLSMRYATAFEGRLVVNFRRAGLDRLVIKIKTTSRKVTVEPRERFAQNPPKF